MRTRTVTLALLLSATAASACSIMAEDDAETSDNAYTAPSQVDDDLLARGALYVLGTPPRNNRAWLTDEEKTKLGVTQGNCAACHDLNATTLTTWAKSYGKALTALESRNTKQLLRDPENPDSGYAPSKAGLIAAAAHLGVPSNEQLRAAAPRTTKQSKAIADAFAGKPEELERFKRDMMMPIEADYARLMTGAYEYLAEWAQRGQCQTGTCTLPKVKDLLPENRPTDCQEDLSQYQALLTSRTYPTWDKINKDAHALMFGCADAAGDPAKCLTDKPAAPEWVDRQAAGSTIRKLSDLDVKTFFWMRTSADGRFVANGGSGGGSHVTDLKTGKNIVAKASYDPDFSPDASLSNGWFMYQGTAAGGGRRCPMSLLRTRGEQSTPEPITFSDAEGCFSLKGAGLYQTVGQSVADNALSDFFIVNNKFASDNPGLTADEKDLMLTAGPDAAVKIIVGTSRGSSGGYDFVEARSMPTPYEGDTMMARSGHIIASRVAGQDKMLGYTVRKLEYTKNSAGAYQIGDPRQVARLCSLQKDSFVAGNKANFSFDERFLTTHHYLTPEERRAGGIPDGKGTADIYIVDFLTGKKVKVTSMKANQFALYPHFRSDGWLYFLVREKSTDGSGTSKEYIAASDIAIQLAKAGGTPPPPPPPPGGGGNSNCHWYSPWGCY